MTTSSVSPVRGNAEKLSPVVRRLGLGGHRSESSREVMVNPNKTVFVQRSGRMSKIDARVNQDDLDRGASILGRKFGQVFDECSSNLRRDAARWVQSRRHNRAGVSRWRLHDYPEVLTATVHLGGPG